MKKLKYLQKLIFLLVMAFSLSFACVACGDDKDDEPIKKPQEQAGDLVGTWWCDHHYGQETDTYTFNADGTYAWKCYWYNSEQGNYAYNHTLRTLTLSTTGKTRLYTIVTLEESYFVMLDQDGGTYTYWKAGTGNDGHNYVDLGLSVKWADRNVGASSPSDYGSYFAWGETRTKSDYSSSTYETLELFGVDIAGISRYDAARANWGGIWRLPTEAECQELVDKCTWNWTTQGGHNGYKVTGPNGNSIFLPAAGLREGTSLSSAGETGDYWSSTPGVGDTQGAYILGFDSSRHYVGWSYCKFGRSVRPVSD